MAATMKKDRWSDKDWVLRKVLGDIENSQSYKQDRLSKWADLDRQYRGRHKHYYAGRSNLFIPITFWTIENLTPRWAGIEQRLIYWPLNDANWTPHAPAMTRFWDHQWRRMKGYEQLTTMIKMAQKYGLAIWRPYWERDVRPSYGWQYQQVNPYESVRFPQSRERVIFDGPKGEVIPPWRFYWHPDAIDVDSAMWCGHMRTASLEELRLHPDYDLSDFENYGGDTTMWKFEYWRNDRLVCLAAVKEPDRYYNNKAEEQQVLDHGSSEQPWRLIFNDKNPLWAAKKPYLKIVDYPLEEKFFGLGTAELLEPLQVELNAMRNLRMDHSIMTMNPVTLVGPGGPQNLKLGPGQALKVQAMKEVEILGFGDLKNAGVHEVNELYKDIQKTVGVNDMVEGGNVNLSRTPASTMQIADQISTIRTAFKSMMLAHTFFVELSQWHRDLNRQFMPDEQVFSIAGAAGIQWMRLPPEVWEQSWDVKPVVVGAEANTPQARTAELLGFVNGLAPILQNSEAMMANGVDPQKIIEKMVLMYQGIFDNPQEVFGPPRQQQQMGMPQGQTQMPMGQPMGMPGQGVSL